MITEVVVYRTRESISEEDHLACAAEAHRGYVSQQPGLRSRALTSAAMDARWVDLVEWARAEDAEHAMRSASASASARRWLGQIELGSIAVRKARTVFTNREVDGFGGEEVGCWAVFGWKTLPGVEADSHLAGDERMHREVLPKMEGYRGARVLRTLDGSEWLELMAWDRVESARAGIERVLASDHPAVVQHLAETDHGSVWMHFAAPRLRFA